MTNDLSNPAYQLNILFGNLQGAHVTCEIWWVYKNSEDRPKYVDVLQRYYFFFKSSIHAQFLATVMGISRLFDRRRGTISVKNLLKAIHKSGQISSSQFSKLEKDLNKLEPLEKKVRTLRNKAFAHITKEKTYHEVFNEAKIAHDHIRDLLDKTMVFLNRIACLIGIDEHGFISEGARDTRRVLEDLKHATIKDP